MAQSIKNKYKTDLKESGRSIQTSPLKNRKIKQKMRNLGDSKNKMMTDSKSLCETERSPTVQKSMTKSLNSQNTLLKGVQNYTHD